MELAIACARPAAKAQIIAMLAAGHTLAPHCTVFRLNGALWTDVRWIGEAMFTRFRVAGLRENA